MTAQKERATTDDFTVPEPRVNLRAKFRRFIAEGGAGRSNTNELLEAIVEELIAVSRVAAADEKKKTSSR